MKLKDFFKTLLGKLFKELFETPAKPASGEGAAESGGGDAPDVPGKASSGEPAAAVAPSAAPEPTIVWRFGGFDGSKAVEDASTQIRDFRFSSSGMTYAWAKGGCENFGAASATDHTQTIACAFYKDDSGRWIGGKFDWISSSRRARSWENIRGFYHGWDPDSFFAAKKHAFCIVSRDGKRRTNLITD